MVLRKLGLLASAVGFFVVAAGQPADAALVTFQTSGVFTSTGTNTVGGGQNNILVTFDGVSEVGLDASDPGAFVPFGTFTISGGPGSTGNINTDFTLTVTQIAPPGGTSFAATYSGNINSQGTQQATVTFNPPLTQAADGFLYTILSPVLILSLQTSPVDVDGHVIHRDDNGDPPPNGIPEPGSLALLGFGLLALRKRLYR